MATYDGIELADLDKRVSMAHTRFGEANEGLECFEALLNRDKKDLTPQQFDDITRLNSVAVFSYQVCNGGIRQYYDEGFHLGNDPFDEQDVAHYGQDEQVETLGDLLDFGETVFPERAEENDLLKHFIYEFADAFKEEEPDEDDEFYQADPYNWDGLHVDEGFDERYYKISDYVETLIEGYAQYLGKAIDLENSKNRPLDDLKKEAQDRAASKERIVPKKPASKAPEMDL